MELGRSPHGYHKRLNYSHFLSARQLLPDDAIVIHSGMYGLSGGDTSTGSPINSNIVVFSAPWRLVVTRLGRIT